MAALGNALGDDVLRRAFADRELEDALRPVIGAERFRRLTDLGRAHPRRTTAVKGGGTWDGVVVRPTMWRKYDTVLTC